MRILNSEYLFGFNWIQLDSIRSAGLKTVFLIQNFELNSIHNVCVVKEKANIIFILKGIEIYSMQFRQMNKNSFRIEKHSF